MFTVILICYFNTCTVSSHLNLSTKLQITRRPQRRRHLGKQVKGESFLPAVLVSNVINFLHQVCTLQ
jgi:hypothetical protein